VGPFVAQRGSQRPLRSSLPRPQLSAVPQLVPELARAWRHRWGSRRAPLWRCAPPRARCVRPGSTGRRSSGGTRSRSPAQSHVPGRRQGSALQVRVGATMPGRCREALPVLLCERADPVHHVVVRHRCASTACTAASSSTLRCIHVCRSAGGVSWSGRSRSSSAMAALRARARGCGGCAHDDRPSEEAVCGCPRWIRTRALNPGYFVPQRSDLGGRYAAMHSAHPFLIRDYLD